MRLFNFALVFKSGGILHVEARTIKGVADYGDDYIEMLRLRAIQELEVYHSETTPIVSKANLYLWHVSYTDIN